MINFARPTIWDLIRRILGLVAVVAALSGCFTPPEPSSLLPRQEEAVEVVWALYGSSLPPPVISWVTNLDCYPDEAGQNWGWMASNANSREPECVGGLTHTERRICQVALRPAVSLAETALAHELLHQALFDITGDGDAWHEGPWGRYVAAGSESWYERGLDDDGRDALTTLSL